MIEAMARGDEVECDRLEDSCPRGLYRCEDPSFRDRMRRAYMIAATVVLNMREGLVRIRMAEALRQHVPQMAVGPAKVAEVAFLYGREYGKWEAGAIEQIDLPEREKLEAEIAANPELKEQLDQLREAVEECVGGVLDEVRGLIGTAHPTEVLSMWNGFGEFCRDALGVDPLTVVRAYGLQQVDPTVDVLTAYPDAVPDTAEAARWATDRARSWANRFARGT
jgi:hypothetical protein